MAGTAPDYSNIRMGGPKGLRIPAEGGPATFTLKKLVSINIGGVGSTNTVTLTPAQALGSEIILTNAGSGATTVVFTGALPGHIFVVFNNSGQAATFKVLGQTGISVATAKRAILIIESADVARVTADT